MFHFSNRDKLLKCFSFFEITSFKFCLYLLYIFIKRAAGFIKARISTSIETHEDINAVVTICEERAHKKIKDLSKLSYPYSCYYNLFKLKALQNVSLNILYIYTVLF